MKRLSFIVIMICSLGLSAQSHAGPTDGDSIYTKADRMPEYPGGMDALTAKLAKEMKHGTVERDIQVPYPYSIILIVEKDGSVGNLEQPAPKYNDIDREFIRVLNQVRFTPGMRQGRPVRVRMVLPMHILYR